MKDKLLMLFVCMCAFAMQMGAQTAVPSDRTTTWDLTKQTWNEGDYLVYSGTGTYSINEKGMKLKKTKAASCLSFKITTDGELQIVGRTNGSAAVNVYAETNEDTKTIIVNFPQGKKETTGEGVAVYLLPQEVETTVYIYGEGAEYFLKEIKWTPKVSSTDLQVAAGSEGNNLILEGSWNAEKFATIINDYTDIWSVNLINVTGLPDIKPSNISNPNCLYYVADETWSNEINIINNADKTAGKIELIDGIDKPFYNRIDFNAASATYTRIFAAPGTYSICLPFAAIVPENVTVLQYVGNNGMTVNFEKVTTIEANVPYLIVVKEANSTIEFTGKVEAEKVLIKLSAPQSIAGSSSEYSFNSNFQPLAAGEATGRYLLNADGTGFVKAGSEATVGSFRAYITTVSEAPSNAPRLVIGKDEGGATSMDAEGLNASELTVYSHGGIMEVVAPEAKSVKVYGIDGRLVRVLELNAGSNTVTGLAKGVYVVGNQKVVVK